MDWDTLHRTRYPRSIERLEFEPRPAICFSVQASSSRNGALSPSFVMEDLLDEASMQNWVTKQRRKSTSATCWPDWSLTVLALQRGPPNEFELRKEGALDQIRNVGCTRDHFEQIMEISNISKAFPECFDRDSSLVYSKLSTLHDSIAGNRNLDVIMRSDQSNLQDMAFGLHYSADRASTFAVVHGCTEKAFRELSSWLPAMQKYAQHPLLMVNLFFELHQRRVEERYRYLRVKTTNLSFEVFGMNEPEFRTTVVERQKSLVSNVNRMGEQVGVVGKELMELRLRLADIKLLFDEIADESNIDRKRCLKQDGDILKDNLTQLDQRVESLQAKNMNISANTERLLPSIFNVIAMKDSQINKELAAAGRRDSSIMVGITVGTLTFFPCTSIATIFALPFFNWNAAPGEHVTDNRFWIYLAVTIPLTMITLLVLAIWLFLADKASREFITVREYVNRLSVKGFVQNERRRIIAKFQLGKADAEKTSSIDSQPEP